MQDKVPQAEFRDLVALVRALAERQRDVGVAGVPIASAAVVAAHVPAGRAAAALAGPLQPMTKAASKPAVTGGSAAAAVDLVAEPGLQEAASLAALRAHIGDCQRCKLAGGRTNLVFGVGNEQAALMFVGEGPGYDEDLKGEPFVGRAGQLLTEIITKGMKLRREDVYIANVVKCRPPGNRNPEPDEIASCMPFLARQIALIKPRVIVALGTFAAQTLLSVRTPITRMRGAWQDYKGIKVMPTFHPAYLLRNPSDKRLVWEDIKKVMGELGME
jgi:uracil-DNA glycosylase